MVSHPASHSLCCANMSSGRPWLLTWVLVVGMARFELAASCSQSRRANQAAPHPAKPTVAYLSWLIRGRARTDPLTRLTG
jgi:hypothetical protein